MKDMHGSTPILSADPCRQQRGGGVREEGQEASYKLRGQETREQFGSLGKQF